MITVFGLWHLGCVTAACCAEHFKTVGFDWSDKQIDPLSQGKAPLWEPGLDDLLQKGLINKKLRFTNNPKQAFSETKLLWVTYDTPVDENDNADSNFVIDQIRKVIPYLNQGTIILISSQLPVGSIKQLEQELQNKQISFAYSPENLRLGKAIDIFQNPDRIIVGVRNQQDQQKLQPILESFSTNIIWMSVESSEMTKHAINSFLALSVTFANELGRLCETMGADAHEVALGMKSESRIGPGAYVSPGGAFAGGTLARDVQFLTILGEKFDQKLELIPSIKKSNDLHKDWPFFKLKELLGSIENKDVAVLGLTYKPGTNTLRRSSSVELCHKLISNGAHVQAFDPMISDSLPEIPMITICSSAKEACTNAEAIIIMTEWPEFKELDWLEVTSDLKSKIIIDQNRFCKTVINSQISDLTYSSVGV